MRRKAIALALSAGVLLAGPTSLAAAEIVGGCDLEIAEMEEKSRREYIARMSVLADVNSSRRPQNFATLTCLERIMNSTMDGFFKPPGLGDLLGALENFICSKANEVFRDVTAPLSKSTNVNLPVGEIIPGVDLGSMRGGVRIRVQKGSAYGTERRNLNEMFGDIYPQQVSPVKGSIGVTEIFQ